MKIPYKRIRLFSTVELPGVMCEPPLQFEFIAAPSFELVRDISIWIKNPTWEETKRLGAELIKAVIVPDNTRYDLGTLETIQEFAGETEPSFIATLINGWNTRIALERIEELKKTRNYSAVFSETNGKKLPV